MRRRLRQFRSMPENDGGAAAGACEDVVGTVFSFVAVHCRGVDAAFQ
jgi:hypothetical protein